MPKYLPVFDNTTNIEEEKESQSFDMGTLKAAGVGALNQFNLLSNIGGAGNTLIGNKLDSSISDEDWKNKSLYEKYQANKDIIQKKVNELEDEYPKASLTGNIAGGIVPALFTGGASLTGTAAKTGAKLLPKVVSTASKVSPNKLKLAGQVTDSSLIAGTDTALFERDPEKRGEAFLKGATLGAAFPLAIKGAKTVLTKGDTTKKYIDRIPEVLELQKANKRPVTELQEKVVEKIKEVEPKLKVESDKIAKKIKETTNSSNLDVQVKGNDLVDKMTEAKINFDKGVSEASNGGYELLESVKDISTKEVEDVIDKAMKKTDMLSDPHAKLLTKYKNRLQLNNGKAEGVELKNIVNAMYADYNDYIDKLPIGAKPPKTYKRIKLAADTANALLKKASPAYAEYMKPLAYQTEKSKNIQNILFGGKKENILSRLKNYKKDIKTQEALDDFREQIGIDLRPSVDNLIDYESTIKGIDNFKEDNLAKAITSSSNSSEYQSFLSAAEKYKQKTGIDLIPEITQLRQDYLVDLLNRAKTLTTEKGESGLTPFKKNMKNLNVQDYESKNIVERILGEDRPSDIKVTQVKSDKARKDIADLSNFIGEDVGKNTKDIEAASLYDFMGTGKANGSRMVNLLGSIGATIGNGVKNIPLVGASLGGLVGAMTDTGKIQRIRREILNSMYNPANATRNDIINKVGRYGAAVTLPSEIQKQENRENQALSTFEDYYKNNRIGDLVDRQQKINEDVFGRR